ncbi:MAG: hypothetical protein IIV72_05090 [Alistipes sp.]|nr:hypothetical protein [Alistipes sp.]
MELLFWIFIGIPLLALGAYLDGKRGQRKDNNLNKLIQQELDKRNFTASNNIWANSLYIATDLQKDEIIIIKYNKEECQILDVQLINFHTTNFLSNGIQRNGGHWFLYSKNATLIYLDNNSKELLVLSSENISKPKRLKFSDILSVELIQDSNIVSKKSLSDTIGRSIIGGALAGNAGAIIGGTTSKSSNQDICKLLQCIVTIRDIQEPTLNITLCNSKEGIKDVKQSDVYKQALLLMNTFSVIIDSCSQSPKEASTSICTELNNLVKLKEQNILTEEEFLILKHRLIKKQ